MNKLTLALAALDEHEQTKWFPVEVEMKNNGIFLRTGGREAWIEFDGDGNLIIHAYNKDIDEPVNLRIFEDRIDVDTDRDNGLRYSDEHRAFSSGK